MYGIGFLVFAIVLGIFYARLIKINLVESIVIFVVILLLLWNFLLPVLAGTKSKRQFVPLSVAGVQMEFPSPSVLPKALNKARAKTPMRRFLC